MLSMKVVLCASMHATNPTYTADMFSLKDLRACASLYLDPVLISSFLESFILFLPVDEGERDPAICDA
jgi:hypothetical protein